MGQAVVLLAAFCLAVRAENPAIPKGAPPSEALAALSRGFTLNAEVLERYGYTLDGYNAMPPLERRRVSDWIEVLEHDRLTAEARAASRRPPQLKLDQKTQESIDRIKAGLSPNFDDGAPGAGGSSWVASLETRGAPAVNGEALEYRNTLRRLSLTDPKTGLRLSLGQIGADGTSPLVTGSPYFGLDKSWSHSGSSLDWDAKASAYALNLGARLYYDDNPGLDAQVSKGLGDLRTAAPDLGIKPGDIDSLSKSLSYSTDFERQWMALGSAMGRVGRAYSLLGDAERGVDWGWSAMGLARVNQIFPNATVDQTAGVRIRPNEKQNIGVFGGVTEGISVFARSMVPDSLDQGRLATDIRPVAAPHAEIASWGKMPYLSGVEYAASAGRQWNPWTTLTSVSGGLSVDAGKGVKVGVFGSYSDESGSDLEYDRMKSAGGVVVKPNPGMDISAQYFNQSAAYGDARVQNQGVMLGLTLRETTPGAGTRGEVTMSALFGGQEHLLPNETSSQMAQLLQDILNAIKTLKDASLAIDGGAGRSWQDLQNAWNGLPSATKQTLGDFWSQAMPSAPPLSRVMATRPISVQALNELSDLLSNTQLMERLLVRYLRHEIYTSLEKVEIPVLGQKLRMNAPMVLAAANAYGLSLTPLAPVTAADARQSLDGFLMSQLTQSQGCKAGGQPQALTDCILSKLPPDQAAQIRKHYGDDINLILKAAIQWPSDVIRREMNQMALQIILACEQLNELTVDKGERIGDMNVRALQASFAYLDDRRRKENRKIYGLAKADLKEDLAAQDAAIKEKLTQYGADRLAWLQAQPAWPQGVRVAVRPGDWPGLLAVYGDAALFDLILRAKAKLAAKGGTQGLLISLDRVSPLNSVVISAGNPAEIRLPPTKVNLEHFDLSL